VSQALHVTALVVALLSIPTVAGLTAWGLAGGDGSPANPVLGGLGALVAFGSLYVAVTCWTAFWGLSEWRWWLMLMPPAAGVLGLALASREGRADRVGDWLVGLGMQVVLAVPALLLWAAGAVSPA
jgi:hypothetical protein